MTALNNKVLNKIMSVINIDDFTRCCRCCLATAAPLQSLFGTSLDEMLKNLFPFKVDRGDDYPQQICSNCARSLSMCYRFHNVVLSSHQSLNDALQKAETDKSNQDVPNDKIAFANDSRKKVILSDVKIVKDGKIELIKKCVEKTKLGQTENNLIEINCLQNNITDNAGETISNALKEQYIENHLDEVKDNNVFKCSHCHTVFQNNNDLKAHKLHHKESCGICGKIVTLSNMRRHAYTHSEKRHACDYCGKVFADKMNLVRHVQTHTGEVRNSIGKPYLCSYCGRKFKWHSSLCKHLKFHTANKMFTCGYCSKSFVEKNKLDMHMVSHTNEKPHACDECGLRFANLPILRKHQLTHAGPSHACEVCGRMYITKSGLWDHQRVHTGETPYKCDECPKTFKWKKSLIVHKHVHEKSRLKAELQASPDKNIFTYTCDIPYQIVSLAEISNEELCCSTSSACGFEPLNLN